MGLRSRLRPLVASCSFCLLLLILLTDEEPLFPSQPLDQPVDEDGPPPVEAEDVEAEVGCPRNKQKKISVRTETRSVLVLFRFVSWNKKLKISVCFGLFRCFEPISKQLKQTELFRNKLNFLSKYQNMLSITLFQLLFCFTVCFGSIETPQLFVSV